MEIRRLTRETAGNLKLKNEPFSKPGRFIPELKDGIWSWRSEAYETPGQETFPEEAYEFDVLDQRGAIFGAYEDGVCVGLGIFQDGFLKQFYLYDLKVCAAAQGRGAGRRLIEAGLEEAKRRGYQGLYTIAQDDNLNACLFYLKLGFQIGGFDNKVYNGTSQAGKGDILFYLT